MGLRTTSRNAVSEQSRPSPPHGMPWGFSMKIKKFLILIIYVKKERKRLKKIK